jgi:hypothetical protein
VTLDIDSSESPVHGTQEQSLDQGIKPEAFVQLARQ